MGNVDELRTTFQEVLSRFEATRPYDHGLLGDGRGTLWVPADSDNRVWFRKNGQTSQLVKVHCWRARPIDGLPVICGYTREQPTFYQVLTCDREMLESNWQGMSSVPRHAEMHIWGGTLGGDDPVMVWTRALMPFRVSPQIIPDYTVQIQGPEMYLWLGTWNRWSGDASFDLSGSYPGAGSHVYVLVSVDGATNLAQVTSGTPSPIALPIATADLPVPPAGCIPVGLVYLVETAAVGNEIEEGDIVDARILVSSSAGSVLPGDHDHSASGGQGGAYIRPAALGVNTVVPDQDGAIAMMEAAADPTNMANVGMIYPKDVGGGTEAFYLDNAGNVVQLTTAGDIRIASLGPIAQGDIIRGVAGPAAATYSANTLGAVLIGDGADVISDTTPILVDVVTINQAADRSALVIDCDATTQIAMTINAWECLYLAQDISNGYGLHVTRDIAEAGANPLADFVDENAANTQATVRIRQDGTGPALQFAGGTGTNIITIPDNIPIAAEFRDAGGLDHIRFVSTDANPYFIIDPANAGILVGIGTLVPDGRLEVTRSAYPVIRGTRTSAVVIGASSGLDMLHRTSADMIDGFGSGITISIEDDAAVVNIAVGIYGLRDGADDTSGMSLRTRNAGAWVYNVWLDPDGNVNIGPTAAPATLLELENVETLTGDVADDYAACLTLDPGYTAAAVWTVTRHNYIDVNDVSVAGAGPAAVTAAAIFRFDAAIGTHKCLPAAFQTTDSGADTTNWAGGLLININGTLYKIPYIAA